MNVLDFFHADAWSALLLITALKGAIIVTCALLATRAMARASASARHAVWVFAFGAALVMPILLVAVPGWQVPVLPEGGFTLGLQEEVAVSLPAVRAGNEMTGLVGSAIGSAQAESKSISLGTLFLLVWGLGAFFVAARWMAGVLSAWVLTRKAVSITDAHWASDVDNVRATLGLKRSVALRMSAHARTPMTWGIFRPVVLLPEGAIRWTADRRMVVLTHELAHVRRLDGLTQWIAQAACVLHWFNPFIWKGYQRFLIEREHACDDYVLAEGTKASSYAEHLLDIAQGLRNQQRAELAMAPMAHRTQIEERLRAILNNQQRRDRLSRRLLFVVCALVISLVWPVTAITFVARDHEFVAQDAPVPPMAPLAPLAPFPPAPPLPPHAPPAPAPADAPTPPIPDIAPPAPENVFFVPVRDGMMPDVMSGPASTSEPRFVVRREVTDAQRRQKRAHDDQYSARLDASLAAEMREVERGIQVDVQRIVTDIEDDRWDSLEERARSVVQRVAVIVAEAEELSATQWDGRSAAAMAATNEGAAFAIASERKRNAHESVQPARPSAQPNRIANNNSSSTCRSNNNEH